MKIIKWIGSLIEEKGTPGKISSKRVGFFYCLFILGRAVENPVANEIAIYTIALLSFGLAGLTVPAWFNKLKKEKDEIA